MDKEQKNIDSSIMSTTDWFITILIASIPLVGLIMLFIWAFDKDINVNKANWAKANLIWYAIWFGIAALILIPTIIIALQNFNKL